MSFFNRFRMSEGTNKSKVKFFDRLGMSGIEE